MQKARLAELVCFALVVAQPAYLAVSYLDGLWLVDPNGAGIATDFVNVWAAGALALKGHGATAYAWSAHKAAEEIAIGHQFSGYYGWNYPPTFLFVAAVLALLRYVTAFVIWICLTFFAYLGTIRTIIGQRSGFLIAAAYPAVLSNFVVGQNGFLSASLMGSTLWFMESRPVIAGVLLGLLSYKPHIGLLFPIALIAGGYWRVFVTASIVAGLWGMAAWVVFGSESWSGFADDVALSSHSFLSQDLADWSKVQTAFGVTRTLGGGEGLAWSLQIILALGAAAWVSVLWRSRVPYNLKAAALGAASLLATPYLFIYDLAVLAVPIAFLWGSAGVDGLLPYELPSLGLVLFLIIIFPAISLPVGFAAVLIVIALIARRVWATPTAPSPSKAPQMLLRADV